MTVVAVEPVQSSLQVRARSRGFWNRRCERRHPLVDCHSHRQQRRPQSGRECNVAHVERQALQRTFQALGELEQFPERLQVVRQGGQRVWPALAELRLPLRVLQAHRQRGDAAARRRTDLAQLHERGTEAAGVGLGEGGDRSLDHELQRPACGNSLRLRARRRQLRSERHQDRDEREAGGERDQGEQRAGIFEQVPFRLSLPQQTYADHRAQSQALQRDGDLRVGPKERLKK
mmetsp:Transcript_60937/g.199507  ORF Transcript_60937/g.199507 Transcript_60937/m.199507 type:complete len:232 (-) Transcript_60937:498-1193(-)